MKAPPMLNGLWYGTVRFGDCNQPANDRGKRFQLLIVTADEQANKAFEEHIAHGAETGEWGMDQLPDGITQYARIVVTRE